MTKDEIKLLTGDIYFDEWYDIVKNIINNNEFRKRLYFPHHGYYNVFTHCIKVSYDSYVFSFNKNIDSRKVAIAGLLHDFYPYLWRNESCCEFLDNCYFEKLDVKKSLFKKHGFTHGKEASLNYVKYFPEFKDPVITNAIKNHMFPLTPPPKNKVGWVVTLFDKTNAVKEMPFWNTIRAYVYIFICLLIRF